MSDAVWWVTGASQGLGRALCQALSQRGAPVLAIARSAPALQVLAAQCPRLQWRALDLADPQQIDQLLDDWLALDVPLAGLINNAGIGRYAPFLDPAQDDWQRLLQVNLHAPIQLCRRLLPRLLRQGHGHIVNISSDLARRPLANMAAYVASKHGLAGFSHSLLREVKAAGIRVSLVNPGMIDTDFGAPSASPRDPAAHLQVEALAELILSLLDQPGAQLIDEISVHPLGQAEF